MTLHLSRNNFFVKFLPLAISMDEDKWQFYRVAHKKSKRIFFLWKHCENKKEMRWDILLLIEENFIPFLFSFFFTIHSPAKIYVAIWKTYSVHIGIIVKQKNIFCRSRDTSRHVPSSASDGQWGNNSALLANRHKSHWDTILQCTMSADVYLHLTGGFRTQCYSLNMVRG